MQKIISTWQGMRMQKYIHKYCEVISDLYFSIYTTFYKNEEFKTVVYVSRDGFVYSNKQYRLCKYVLTGNKYFLSKLDINDFLKEDEMNNDIIKKEFNEAMLSNVKDLSIYFGL